MPNYERMEDAPTRSRISLKAVASLVLAGVCFSSISLAAYKGRSFTGSSSRTSLSAVGAEEVVVPLGKGSVRGWQNKHSGRRFRGIPYAKAERFRNSVPVDEIVGELDAREFAASCMRGSSHFSEPLSEDCLHLNIYTPTLPSKVNEIEQDAHLKIPVLVWFHGGSFTMGAGSDSHIEDVEELVTTRRMIVVTINYRLGIFGFLGSENLRHTAQDSVGNFGTLDQQMALKWLQQNIASFGGDPQQISLVGWSAGAASVSDHLCMPSSQGLFTKGIMMSGGFTLWAAQTMDDAHTDYNDVLKFLGCDNSPQCLEPGPPCDCLMSKSKEQLVKAQDAASQITWAPTVDGTHLPKHPVDALNAGECNKGIPIIIGGAMEDALEDIGAQATAADFANFATSEFGLKVPQSRVAEVMELYLEKPALPAPTANGLDRWSPAYWAYRRASADQAMNCVARRAAALWEVKTGASAYWYVWAQGPSARYADPPVTVKDPTKPAEMGGCWPCPGATHGSDIPFLFERNEDTVDDSWQDLADLYQVFFRNMVYDGDPNKWKGVYLSSYDEDEELQEAWPAAKGGKGAKGGKAGMIFDAGKVKTDSDLKSKECDFWDEVPR